MDAPSNELKSVAEAPKPDTKKILIEWGKLLGKLKIVHVRSATSRSLARAVNFTLDKERADEGEIFVLDVYPTVAEFLDGKVSSEALMVWFSDSGEALIADNIEFLEENRRFRGTWEEVARELFEMEKLMLARVPQVPADLRQS